jgi:hypothetical protein
MQAAGNRNQANVCVCMCVYICVCMCVGGGGGGGGGQYRKHDLGRFHNRLLRWLSSSQLHSTHWCQHQNCTVCGSRMYRSADPTHRWPRPSPLLFYGQHALEPSVFGRNLHSVNRDKRSEHPRGMPLATRMAALQVEEQRRQN